MRANIFVLLLLLLSVQSYSQTRIQWTKELNWKQVFEKAKAENKYVFVDCYTTWCAPCHAMDKNVFTDNAVGSFFNEKFISIKIQMDKTNHDSEEIKKWYDDVKSISRNYTVTSFPTFLFFSPDGKPLHKVVGYKDPTEFVKVGKEAFDVTKQYYAILENYQPGKLDTSELKGLARAFRFSGKELAGKIAAEYLGKLPFKELTKNDNQSFMAEFNSNANVQEIAYNYLKKIPKNQYNSEPNFSFIRNFKAVPTLRDLVLNYLKSASNSEVKKQLNVLRLFKKDSLAKPIADKYIKALSTIEIYTKINLQFIGEFTKSSKDRGFNLFYTTGKKVDAIMGVKGYANGLVCYVIDLEEVSPFMIRAEKDDNVPWMDIVKAIEKKYNKQYADEIVLDAKVRFYEYLAKRYNKNWPEYIKYNIEKIERFGTDTTNSMVDATALNNFVFDAIFYYSTDTSEMNIGLKWMEGVLRRNPKEANNIDTYANLLYKIGRIEEAIQWQEKALMIAKEEKQDYAISSIEQNLLKMKQGIATWIKSENK
jgi:thioredoxin-related protein